MLHSGILFDAVALPYDLLTRHPIWERHCAQMAAELPAGAQRILDLGCGPGQLDGAPRAGRFGGRLFAGDAAQDPTGRSGAFTAISSHSASVRASRRSVFTLRLRLAYIAAKFGSATATSYRAFPGSWQRTRSRLTTR
jgi:hypothetical protein